MTTTTRWLAAALLVGLVSPALAEKDARTRLSDEANLFSKTAKETAEPVLADIQRLNKEFVIETFAAPPEAVPDKERAAYFAKWASERARAEKVNGVYLLVCKEPGRFELLVGNETKKKAFREADRKELRTLLETKFKSGEFDEALDAGVEFVRDRMRANLKGENPVNHVRDEYGDAPAPTAAAGSDVGWLRWVWIGLAVLLGIWILRALFVALSGMGGGGSFMGMFFGGLFGAMAGMWIYDSFFGSGSSWGGGGDGGTGGDAGATDTDYSGDGGDFGGGDGGGDF